MSRSAAATRHVVERCPSCGVEHDHPTHECEACGNPVRHWCRAHSHETGWLDGPACARCAEVSARPAPRPRPATTLPCPAPAISATVNAAAAPPAEAAVDAAKVAASLAEVSADAARAARRGPDGGVMFTILFFFAAGGAFGGMVVSTPWVLDGSGVNLDALVRFLVAGGIAGLLFGVYVCRMYVQDLRARGSRP
jgi:hypothetical protein